MNRAPSIELLESRIAPATIALGTGTTAMGNTSLGAADLLTATINDALGSGKLAVTGTVAIDGTMLTLTVSQLPQDRDEFMLVDNDDTDAITGTGFADLPEGAVFKQDDSFFQISYTGGDGNDVVLKALVPEVKISTDGKTASFIDEDGDQVTLKTTKGSWNDATFRLVPTGDFRGGAHLEFVGVGDGMGGAQVTIKSKPSSFGGNGFVNVTEFSAPSDIVTLSIDGDVGRLDLAGATLKPIKSITIHSLGQLGESNRPLGTNRAQISTSRPIVSLTVQGDITDGGINGDNVQKITVGGSIRGDSNIIVEKLGSLVVVHDISGADEQHPVVISAFGNKAAPVKGVDNAIDSITVGGRVEQALIIAGSGISGGNADASIGKVTVDGDWIASSLIAGTGAGLDNLIGTGDDVRLSGMGVRDQDNLIATIGSIVIKGQTIGTADNTTDNFGIVSEFIKKAKIGPIKIPLVGTPRTPEDRFFLAVTGPGGDGSVSDFSLLETIA